MVEYSYYVDTYGGSTIKESDWPLVARKAERKLHEFTFNRITELADRDKLAVCEMADYMMDYKQREGKSSESTDGYSVSYNVDATLNHELYDIVRSFYSNTGLLYCGVDYAT